MATKNKKALEEMTKDELVKEAKKQKVKISGKANKQVIIEAIKKAQPVVMPIESTEPEVTTPEVGVAPLQQQQSVNVVQQVAASGTNVVRDEIWESENRKAQRLLMDPTLKAL